MNQSFNAFGSLLLMLAVAMLAVNSGSRTTMFDQAATKKSVLGAHPSPLGGIYVVVLPAADEEEDAVEIAIAEDIVEVAAPEVEKTGGEDFDSSVDDSAPTSAAESDAELRTPVRSGRWLLRFAVSSLNQLGRACEAAASQIESLEGESVASKDLAPSR